MIKGLCFEKKKNFSNLSLGRLFHASDLMYVILKMMMQSLGIEQDTH